MEFKQLRQLIKKGLLLKKEYRGSRGLDLEIQGVDGYYGELKNNKYIRRIAKEIKGYLRRLKHVSIKFDFRYATKVSILPLLKSIKRNFVCLVSLKLSSREGRGFLQKNCYSFDRLFTWLGPTLKHLDLDFNGNKNFEVNFLQVLGSTIMKNLQRLETLRLDFGRTRFSISIIIFLINKGCSHMPHLRSLNLQMVDSFVYNDRSLPQISIKNNLRSLVLNLDRCWNLSTAYLSYLQHDITAACPALEELYIRVANYKRFSHSFLSSIEEKLLQKLNLKRLFLERSLEEILDRYQNMQNEEVYEEETIEELLNEYKPKGLREEELAFFWEFIFEDQEYFEGSFDIGEQDYLLRELQFDQEERERNEIEEQDEADRILREELAEEEEYEVLKFYNRRKSEETGYQEKSLL